MARSWRYSTPRPGPSAKGKEVYLVSDLGASFGTTYIVPGLRKSRGNLSAYESSKFVTQVTAQYVDFATPSRPTFLELGRPPEFLRRMRMRSLGRRVPRTDVKWMAHLLR